MNQLDLVNEKVLDTEGGGFDWSAVPSDRMFCQGCHRLPCDDIGDVHSAAQATSRHPSAFT